MYLYGVIEGHIAALLPAMLDISARSRDERLLAYKRSLREQDRELHKTGTTPSKIIALREFSMQLINHLMPPPIKRIPKGPELLAGDRWERALRGMFLGPPAGRPLPDDLLGTLNEIGEVRSVLMHHLGFVDQRVLDANFEGPWQRVGERVAIDLPLYRRYIAALYGYSEEIQDRFRIRGHLGPARYQVTQWRAMVPAGG